jgi:hypothetical protein
MGVIRPGIEQAGLVGFIAAAIDHGGQRLEFELNLVGKILGPGAGRLHAGDDGLADIAHPVVGQCRKRAVAMRGELGSGFQD